MPFRFAISATFTAEPIAPSLTFWGRELQTPFEIRFAPYNQIAQTLADPAGEFAANPQGVNVVLLRLEDLAQVAEADSTQARIESNLEEIIRLVREALPRMSAPLIFTVCPPSPNFLEIPGRREFAHEMLLRTEAMLQGTPGVLCLTHEEIHRLYPVADAANTEGERLGRIPYTDLYFCALATALVRTAHSFFAAPFKVIALDCDNTLWDGICGEDGPRGVAIDPPRQSLQEFMLQQHDSGMLLAMASKNNEADVVETFATHPEMPLQLRHFVSWRLNWDAKSSNLRHLADELSLGLDSFVLVDDNPKECAEVTENIPDVLVLPLPSLAEDIPRFLDHVWAFDHAVVTEEDRNRSAHYKNSLEFGRELSRASSMESFIRGLDLRVRIRPVAAAELARVSQLTQRTNQFNFTSLRRTEAEIGALLVDGQTECLTVDVSDRFGDYGLTGVVLFRAVEEALDIDTLLLSCRILGRGVEHRVMAHLGSEAMRRGLRTVNAVLRRTSKNEPARRFLHEIGARFERSTPQGFAYQFPAAELSNVQWRAPAEKNGGQSARSESAELAKHKRPDYLRIARTLGTPEQILEAVRREARPSNTSGLSSDTAARLATIWSELLHKPGIAMSDNFFDLGGHSLLAVMLIVRVRETFGIELAIEDVYEATLTFGDLVDKIEAYQFGGRASYDALYTEIENMPDEKVKELLAAEDPGVSLP